MEVNPPALLSALAIALLIFAAATPVGSTLEKMESGSVYVHLP